MRRINDALGRFYSTLVYVCNTWKRSSHSHMHLCMHAHGHKDEETALELERRRRLARERVLQNISGWLREMQFVQARALG